MSAFLTLGALICLASLFCIAVLTGVAAVGTSELLQHLRIRGALTRHPEFAFLVRVAPCVVAAGLTFGLVVPAFLFLEPRGTVENPEAPLLACAAAGLVLTFIVIARCISNWRRTQQIIAAWMASGTATRLTGLDNEVIVLQAPRALLAVAGILRPRIFVSDNVVSVLDSEELQAALSHEVAHIRKLDNLKLLLSRAVSLPRCFKGWAALEDSWRLNSELSCDKHALLEGVSAVSLGSAIVKVARLLANTGNCSEQAALSYLVPTESDSWLGERIRSLDAYIQEAQPLQRENRRTSFIAASAALALGYVLLLPSALPAVHRWIEIVVR